MGDLDLWLVLGLQEKASFFFPQMEVHMVGTSVYTVVALIRGHTHQTQ